MVTSLVDDLTAIDSAGAAGGAGQAGLSATRASLLSDVGRARSLGSPGGSLVARWSSALAQVEVVAGELAAGGPGAQNAELRPQAEAAAEALVSFVARMERQPAS